ncbi:hypothetical protein GCM10007103_10800 [Salinimicrobium marinum]|uniref:DUF4402 domain-containing protein n=2 Tax=Salinimicrobium marinum TaxID=680283 RepID=A0A918SC08_9FLAO|nr:hypothetical protein GCM10007103_10800 [Salinimicrobium marinum]
MVLSFSVKGQTSATASFTASVTIIQPIGITTTSNMNFANLDAKDGGAVILTPENTRISTGGVSLEDDATVSAAAFEVTGEEGFAFSITLPENDYILTNGSESMIIKDFTSSLAEGGSISGGSRTVRVGATLDVHPNQTPGIYNSPAPMNVTVNYN